MTERAMILEETARILARLPRPLKKLRHARPSADSVKALREAGVSAVDAAILVEGAEHEARYLAGGLAPVRFRSEIPPRVADALDVLQEQVGSGAATDAAMIPGYGWTAHPTTAGTFTHEAHGSLHVAPGRWTHRDRSGVIRGSGVNQESMTGYLRGLRATGDAGTQPAATEALDDILARVRGTAPGAPAAAYRLVEAIRARAGRTATGDLHERLRKAATR